MVQVQVLVVTTVNSPEEPVDGAEMLLGVTV